MLFIGMSLGTSYRLDDLQKLITGLRQRSSPIKWSVELFSFDSLLIAARKLVALRGEQRLRQPGKNGYQQANADENIEHGLLAF